MSEVMKPDPIAWVYQNANTEHQYLVWHKQEKGRNWTPIFTLQDVQDAILAERMEILKLLREQAEFWKEWEYPEEYIFAVGVLTERIKCKPTSK